MKLNEDVEMDTPTKLETKKNQSMIRYLIAVVIIALLVNIYVVQVVEVDGPSMMNTLQNKNRVMIDKISYRVRDPHRFDIVVFQPYHEQKKLFYIKRIIGLPGETIQIKDGNLYINGKLLEENFGKEEIIVAGLASKEIVLGETEYFLLGDNRNVSKDSRFVEVGNVDKSQILGRAFVRIWPLNKIGKVE